jgi:hypothetical protein
MKIKVAKELRAGLSARFDYNNKELSENKNYYEIPHRCDVCGYYGGCSNCPFSKEDNAECIDLIYDIFSGRQLFNINLFINWLVKDDKVVKRQLAKLRKYAEKHIEWI